MGFSRYREYILPNDEVRLTVAEIIRMARDFMNEDERRCFKSSLKSRYIAYCARCDDTGVYRDESIHGLVACGCEWRKYKIHPVR